MVSKIVQKLPEYKNSIFVTITSLGVGMTVIQLPCP